MLFSFCLNSHMSHMSRKDKVLSVQNPEEPLSVSVDSTELDGPMISHTRRQFHIPICELWGGDILCTHFLTSCSLRKLKPQTSPTKKEEVTWWKKVTLSSDTSILLTDRKIKPSGKREGVKLLFPRSTSNFASSFMCTVLLNKKLKCYSHWMVSLCWAFFTIGKGVSTIAHRGFWSPSFCHSSRSHCYFQRWNLLMLDNSLFCAGSGTTAGTLNVQRHCQLDNSQQKMFFPTIWYIEN